MIILNLHQIQHFKIVNFTGKEFLDKNFEGNKYESFRVNNKYHRYFGPARTWSNNEKEYYFNDNLYGACYNNQLENFTYKDYLKAINKQWLL